MKRVLLTDGIAADAVKVLESFGGIEAFAMGTPAPEELLRLIPDCDAIILRSSASTRWPGLFIDWTPAPAPWRAASLR